MTFISKRFYARKGSYFGGNEQIIKYFFVE